MASRSSTLGLWLIVTGAGMLAGPAPARAQAAPGEYGGMCDASAAAAVAPDSFVVASDGGNVLRLYRRDQKQPLGTVDLEAFLRPDEDARTDIEGAAAILGPDPRTDRIYWIASHSRNSEGNKRPSRHRLFATEVAAQAGQVTVTPVGAPYFHLIEDLLAATQLQTLRLAEAAKLRPESENGLNIEGLAATPDGGLLIGFRNPRPGGNALVVPLDNPSEVVAGSRARLGQPIELDLGGLGIRSLERVGDRYLIVAGPFDEAPFGEAGGFALYEWSGIADEPPVERADIDFADLRPEALFTLPGDEHAYVLSDDGKRKIDDKQCEDQDREQEVFRSIVIAP